MPGSTWLSLFLIPEKPLKFHVSSALMLWAYCINVLINSQPKLSSFSICAVHTRVKQKTNKKTNCGAEKTVTPADQ